MWINECETFVTYGVLNDAATTYLVTFITKSYKDEIF